MVKLHVKQGSEEFIYETKVSATVDAVTREIATMYNLKMQLSRLCEGLRMLARHGPMKPLDERGLSDDEIAASIAARAAKPLPSATATATTAAAPKDQKTDSKSGDTKMTAASTASSATAAAGTAAAPAVNPHADPAGIRNGKPSCQPGGPEALLKAATEIEAIISNNHAKLKHCMTLKSLNSALKELADGTVKKAHPEGLPEWDSVRAIVSGHEDLTGQESSKYVLDAATCSLWAFNKQWIRDGATPLSAFAGSNDKAIIIVKLAKKGAGAPAREPAVDEATQRAIMAMHRKQEDERALMDADNESAYLNSEWANPKAFKNNAQGIASSSAIKFRVPFSG